VLATAEPLLRHYWYPLAFAEDLGPVPLARRLLGTDLVLWQGPDGRPAAARDRCPHREAALSGGWSTGGRLVCPYHGWEFGADGRCELIPQNAPGQRPNPRAVLETFPATTALGMVWVCLSPEPWGGIPVLGEHGSAGWRTVREFDVEWPCGAPHLLDNNLDLAHFAFVHQGTFGRPESPRVEATTVERTAYGMVARSAAPVAARPGETVDTHRVMTSEVHAPFTGLLRISYPDGLEHVIVKAIAPVDDRTCRLLQVAVRNDTEEQRPAEQIVAFDTAVGVEDRSILERVPADFPTDLGALVHIDTDKASVAYRRLLGELTSGAWRPQPVLAG